MAERIITPDWLTLHQAMYGSRVTPLWTHKHAHGKKSAMIVLSGHFKTLIFYKIFDVLSSKLYGDHYKSPYINTFPFDRVLSPIDRYRFELTQLVTEMPLFVRPVKFYIRGYFVLDSTAAHQGLTMCVLPLFLSFPSHLSVFANYHHCGL